MLIKLEDILKYAGDNLNQRNYIEGERVFNANHIITCGIKAKSSDRYVVSAFCLQTTNLKEKPHEIEIVILSNERIESCTCTCKSGSKYCKHIIAGLLYCYKHEDLEIFSCTDQQCQWKKPQKRLLENYQAASLLQHSCFLQTSKKQKILKTSLTSENSSVVNTNEEKDKTKVCKKLTEEEIFALQNIATRNLVNSSFTLHRFGRHSPVLFKEPAVTDSEKKAMAIIYELQNNALMEEIKNLQISCDHQKCCEMTLENYNCDVINVCEKTKLSYAHWLHERKYRITGSTCYGLYAYMKNKKPDWNTKFEKYFAEKKFKTKEMEYGSKTESEARAVFQKKTNKIVHEVGLVVSRQNPWLGFSPDGVVFDNYKPTELLEIKCPAIGEKKSLEDVINDQVKKEY